MPKRALVVAGEPASGKSVLGRALAARLGAAYLDLDILTAPLVAVVGSLVGTEDLDDPRLSALTREGRYRSLVAVAAENLALGTDVVLTAPFSTERADARAWQARIAPLQDTGAEVALIWLRADAQLLLQRLRARGADRDAGKLARAQEYATARNLAEPTIPHIAVDAAAETRVQEHVVLNRIGAAR